MKDIEKKDKRKIVLSLLIAMAFILPATSAFGSNSVEEVDASDEQTMMKNIGETTPTNLEVSFLAEHYGETGPVTAYPRQQPLVPVCNVTIESIAMLENMPVDCYDITIEICKEAIPPACCPNCEVKVFADIFKVVPIPREDIYCTNFEDVEDIYNNWDSVDANGGPGGIDTWTWSDQRYNSAGHSFRCTQFNGGYLGNQLDYLQTFLQNTEGYDGIEITFWNWCEGEGIETGTETLLKDYGWVEYKLDSGPWTDLGVYFYDNDWEEVSLNITGASSVSTIGIRFAWTSGPTIQNEGWYIDDVCFYGKRSPDEYHVFQTHSIGPILVDDPCVTYIFPETWCPDEGEYIIEIWMLSETSDCQVRFNQSHPFIFNVKIGDVTDIAVIANSYAGTSPFEMGDDLVVSATVENIGTLDAVNLPVTFSIKEQIITTHLDDFVEGDPSYDPYTDVGIWRAIDFDAPGRIGIWHIDDFDFVSPTQSWFCADDTDHYPAGIGDYLCLQWDPAGIDIADHVDDLAFDVTGMINYRLNPGDRLFSFAVVGSTWISFGWTSLHGIHPMYGDDTGGWQPFSMYDIYEDAYGLGGFFGSIEQYLATYGDGTWDSFGGIGFLLNSVDRDGTVGEPGGAWSGVMLDNIQVKSVVAGAELYKEVVIIPELKAETSSTPPGQKNLIFEWLDMPTGNFVEEKSVPSDDDDDNNAMGDVFVVITDINDVDETDVDSYDYTSGTGSHWHITTSGYDNYLWCGYESTGTYGDDWNDVVLLAPAGSDPDPSLDMSGLSTFTLEFDEYCEAEGRPYDYGIIEINPSVSTPGSQWYYYKSTTPVFGPEDFEGAFPPTGWQVIDYYTTPPYGTWEQEDYGDDSPLEPPAGPGKYAQADSDTYATAIFDTGLVTPAIDMSVYSSYRVDFPACIFWWGEVCNLNVYSGSGMAFEETLMDLMSPLHAYPMIGYFWSRTFSIPIDPSGYTPADKDEIRLEFRYDTLMSTWLGSLGIDDVTVYGMVGVPEPGDGYYGWQHFSFAFSPNMFFNPYTDDTFEDDIGSTFTDDMGFRFRWVSDESYHDRGWLLDNIEITGSEIFPEDPCDNMDNFLLGTITGGDWWTQTGPTQWTCMDQVSMLIPNDLNNALVWDTSVPQAFYAELHFEHDYDLELNEDFCYLEFSTNGGSSWTGVIRYSGVGGGAVTIDMTAFIGENVLIRWRVDSDEATPSNYYTVENMYITGMVDTVAPVTTGTFAGTVLHGWFNTPVTMTLTAVDDLTGVKDIFYTIDGGSQTTYSTPVSISSNGDHTVEFWSVDNVNNEETPHHTVSFKIDTGDGPSVSITAPTNGLYLFGNKLLDISRILIIGSFTIEATASDADSGVASVEFFLDGTSIGSDTSSPYSILCGAKHSGAGTIKAVARDYAGNEAEDTLDVTYYKFL